MVVISDGEDKDAFRKKLKEEFHKQKFEIEEIEAESIGTILKERGGDIAVEVVIDVIKSCIPVAGSVVGQIISNVVKAMSNRLKQSK